MPRLSIVIATLNPRRDVLDWTLDALASQTMRDFEVVIADNGSSPPVDGESLATKHGLDIRVVRELHNGVTFARCAGILAARCEWIVFVDDDNGLDANYLEESLGIIERSPEIGAFGGVAVLGCDEPVPEWMEKLLPYLGIRDYGPEIITSREDRWGPWEPIGAGMVFRRDIGLKFVQLIERDALARTIGRRGKSLICGEDSLLARMAYRMGYACSYQPSLRLTHRINPNRMSAWHLAKTVEGVARSFVIYETVLGRPQPDPKLWPTLKELAGRFRHRTKTKGLRAGGIEWFWDVGYFRHSRLLNRSEGRKNGAEVLHRHSEL